MDIYPVQPCLIMKVLVISDIHGSRSGLRTTLEMIDRHDPDLVVVCGDITNFGPTSWAEGFLKQIDVPVAAVPGNCDPPGLEKVFEPTGTADLHGKKWEFSDFTFIGAGGADYTPFDTLYEFGDDTFSKMLDPIIGHNMILVTHAPPHRTVDVSYNGQNRGSGTLRQLVERWHPVLSLCGHIHEGWGYMRLERTVVVNPGPAKDSRAALVEIMSPDEYRENCEKELVGNEGDEVAEKQMMWVAIRKSIQIQHLRL